VFTGDRGVDEVLAGAGGMDAVVTGATGADDVFTGDGGVELEGISPAAAALPVPSRRRAGARRQSSAQRTSRRRTRSERAWDCWTVDSRAISLPPQCHKIMARAW
jgi:hypothetical protein